MSINPNYIHHITDEEYSQVLKFISERQVPENKSRSGVARFKRRWKTATVETRNGKEYIIMDLREVVPHSKVQEILSKLYDNPLTGGFGRDKFYERVKQQYIGISRADVEKFIANDETRQLYRPVTNKMKVVRPVAVPEGPHVHWQMDLIDMGDNRKHENLGYQYCLTVIDIFSKYVWVKQLKSKEASEVVEALKSVLAVTTCPTIIQSDNGGEFKNKLMTALCKKYSVKQVFSSAYRPQSQGCIERFNGTLKRLLFLHMARFKTKVWVDILDDVVANYRSMKHSSTGYPPSYLQVTKDVKKINEVRERIVKRNNKWLEQSKQRHFKTVSVGDHVRLSNEVFKESRRISGQMKKSSEPNWTNEIFKVESVSDTSATHLPMYRVKGISTGKVIQVYRDDLQLIPGPNPRVTDSTNRQRNRHFSYREDHRSRATHTRISSESSTVVVPQLVPNRSRRQRKEHFLRSDPNFTFY